MKTTEHPEREPQNTPASDELQFELPNVAERPVGYRRPDRNKKSKTKKKRFLGVIALVLVMAALVMLGAVLVKLLLNFRSGALSGESIRLLRTVGFVGAVLSGLSIITAVVALCLQRQKRAMPIVALVLSLLTLAACAAGLYLYEYIVGDLRQDEQFNNLSNEELQVVQVEADGEVLRETEEVSTVNQQELQEMVETADYDKIIEWEPIDYKNIPFEARKRMQRRPIDEPSYLLKGSDQITNYLLFGLDAIDSSDSIILLSVDRAHRKIKMISLPRDSYVMMPEWGSYAKLAYPYHWGGAERAVRTINYNFFLDVKDYISVDFEQLSSIVDLVGGVEVELNADEAYGLRYKQSGLTVGKNLLYGDAALAFARTRKSSADDTEIKRTGRQREVLISIMQSVKKMSIKEYPVFIRACLGMCTTSLQAEELIDIALEAVQGNYTIESYSLLEMTGVDYWGGVFGESQYFYCVYDLHRASDVIYRAIYEDLYISGYPKDYGVESDQLTQ